MFRILYIVNLALLRTGIFTHQFIFIPFTIGFHILITLWYNDNLELHELKQKIASAKDNNDILQHGNKKAKEFKDLNWFQKIIYLTAFKAGAEYILNKLK